MLRKQEIRPGLGHMALRLCYKDWLCIMLLMFEHKSLMTQFYQTEIWAFHRGYIMFIFRVKKVTVTVTVVLSRAWHRANWLALRMTLPAWNDPLGESFSTKSFASLWIWLSAEEINETLLHMLDYAAANVPLYAPHKPHKRLVTCFGINSGMNCKILHEHEIIAHLVS